MSEKQDIFTIMGGKVKIARGVYNPTSDAVWLAAFVGCNPKTVLDVGAGTGAVALCLMARIKDIQMTELDISQDMLGAAAKNFALNNQVAEFINADILSWRTKRTFDLVITNPPYFRGTPAMHNAHHNADLGEWTRRCIARVKPNGMFATIIDAKMLGVIVANMAAHCGDIKILPLFSKKTTAERVLVSGRVGSRTGTTIFTGISINCDKILRDGLSVQQLMQLT